MFEHVMAKGTLIDILRSSKGTLIDKPKWAFRLVDKVQVKGKSEKVSIYTV